MYDEQPGEAGQLQYRRDQIDVRRQELRRLQSDIRQTRKDLDEVERRCREDLARLS